ncbi:MAG: hypothetical protein ACE5GT_07235 [Rhodospirillales bacterium]
MPDSRARRPRRRARLGAAGLRAWTSVPAAALLVVAFAFGAGAQQDQPIQLSPPTKLAPPPAAEQEPRAGSPEHIRRILQHPRSEPLGAPPTAAASGVQVDDLKSIDPDTAGALTEDRGGFGTDMWKGTDRAIVERLLPQLPVYSASSVMRDLMRRMLLSIARVPEGKSEGASLVAIRARLLAAMGDLVAVNTLLNATPGRGTDQELVRVETESRFLANDNARACALAGGQIRDQNVPYWQKAFLFCQALAGEHDKAALGVSIMRESGDEDEVFFALIDSLGSGVPATLTTLADPTPLHLAMARVAKAKLPADVISSNRPGVLRTIAISPNAPLELRLEAAERAEAAGALPVDALRQLYTSVSFSEDDLANPLSRAETEGGPMTRALLYHTSLVQTVPTAQAEVVARAFALGREEGRYESVVRVFMPVLKRIPPSAELLWFAPEAIRALLLNKETLAADAWFGLMRASALFDKGSSQSIAALMPIVRMFGSSEADEWSTRDLPAWWAFVKDREEARAEAALLYSLFDALGEPVPAESWKDLLGDDRAQVTMPGPALWFRLVEATEASRKRKPVATRTAASSDPTTDATTPPPTVVGGETPVPRERIGETVLLVLLALGEEGPAGADPLLLHQVLTSLRAIGLEKEARAMAVEAALAAGL